MMMVPTSHGAAAAFGVRQSLRLRIGLWLLTSHETWQGAGVAGPQGRPARLPSVRALAARTGAHRNTIAAVYRDLDAFGLVVRLQGSGTYARRPRARSAEGPLFCADRDLAALASAELGRPVLDEASTSGVWLAPLDAPPPPARRVVPLAPSGACLASLAGLSPGADVGLISGSARMGELVRNVLNALHGDAVGLRRYDPDACRPSRPEHIDLWLRDVHRSDGVAVAGPLREALRVTLVPGRPADGG